jgi:hypothetical protein
MLLDHSIPPCKYGGFVNELPILVKTNEDRSALRIGGLHLGEFLPTSLQWRSH